MAFHLYMPKLCYTLIGAGLTYDPLTLFHVAVDSIAIWLRVGIGPGWGI